MLNDFAQQVQLRIEAVEARGTELATALVAWFTFFALTCEAADSMLNANYGALLPEVYPTEKRRATANAGRP